MNDMGKNVGKLFVVSDVHGHYTELMRALDAAGFDSQNKTHVFVSCGDLFDRGNENLKVYDFVKGLHRKILIKGNHEDMLYSALERGTVTTIEMWNGMDITIGELFGAGAIDRYGVLDAEKCADKITEIMCFIDEMSDYYETGDYILMHGWLPVMSEGQQRVRDDWRNANAEDWRTARFSEWQQKYRSRAIITGKTIVCGHRAAQLGYMFDSSRSPVCSEPFYGEGMIAIDACTVKSGRVNVLVIDQEGES